MSYHHSEPTTLRFFKYIDFTASCWLWTGSFDSGGYGRLRIGQRKYSLAHRFSYQLFVGPVPEGLHLDHLCRVRSYVNPEHLEPVTRKENILRGMGAAAANARKTHCPAGHPYEGDNLRSSQYGRQCRACEKNAYRKRKALPQILELLAEIN
jgi:hypothetical protein